MTVIAKNEASDSQVAAGWREVLERVRNFALERNAHLASMVVLVPYAQLMAEARRQWSALFPDGFVPRFESTRNWAQSLGAASNSSSGFRMDIGCDSVTGRSMLDAVGLSRQSDSLLGLLLEDAEQLCMLAASKAGPQRKEWAEQAKQLLNLPPDGNALQLESAAARVALEWVLASEPETDVLFQPGVRAATRLLVVLQGFHPDPLAQNLALHWGEDALCLSLREAMAGAPSIAEPQVMLHASADSEDEAQRAAACVLGHLAAGRKPVALAANDRALTRRIAALLTGVGVEVKDENGWTLSTTRAAASIMATLHAAKWNATADEVLDWLKALPPSAIPALPKLEKWLRRLGVRQWNQTARHVPKTEKDAELASLYAQIEAWRTELGGTRTLTQWLASLRGLLQQASLWNSLAVEDAGARALTELRLPQGLEADLEGLGGSERRMNLSQFTTWANEVLEAGRYKPETKPGAHVIVLPMPQLLARPFQALVLPGCDEKRLLAAPEPPGQWTSAQRETLGLTSRSELEVAQRAAWASALRTPYVDILWRTSDEGGEPLLASPLVLAHSLDGGAQMGVDARIDRHVPATAVARPMPSGAALPIEQLSSSAYSDLRHCPYRFYALRLLKLQEADELDAEVDKRDFGTWLHATLQHFHHALQEAPTMEQGARVTLMDTAAERATRELHLDEGDFLPFSAGWPALRTGYLQWLAKHEGQGAEFSLAEHDARQPLGNITLVGKLDRIDVSRDADSGERVRLVIDYKTENETFTRKRINAGSEDLQLAFYAALLQDDVLRAAYVNVGERGETRAFEQDDVVQLRDELVEGILNDMGRIASGAPMPALGEGTVCNYCAARGLCRKDFWA